MLLVHFLCVMSVNTDHDCAAVVSGGQKTKISIVISSTITLNYYYEFWKAENFLHCGLCTKLKFTIGQKNIVYIGLQLVPEKKTFTKYGISLKVGTLSPLTLLVSPMAM